MNWQQPITWLAMGFFGGLGYLVEYLVASKIYRLIVKV